MKLADFWTHPRTKKLDRDRQIAPSAMALYAYALSTKKKTFTAAEIKALPIQNVVPASRLLIHTGFLARNADTGNIDVVELDEPKPKKSAPKKKPTKKIKAQKAEPEPEPMTASFEGLDPVSDDE